TPGAPSGQTPGPPGEGSRRVEDATSRDSSVEARSLLSDPLAARLAADQHRRWQEGERVLVEDYLLHHPELASDGQAACDLVYSEYLLREQAGEHPDLQEYEGRFPRLAAGIRELHEFVELGSILPMLAPEVTEPGTGHPAAGPGEEAPPVALAEFELLRLI